MGKTIILIACVSQKLTKKAKAKDIYISQLFKSSFDYATRQKPHKIFILSALHHLLDINRVIEPYNVTLSTIPKAKRKKGLTILTSFEKIVWGKKVLRQLSWRFDLKNDKFIVLAGVNYIKPIEGGIANLVNPLKGKGIGQRIKFLSEN
jgi:hypothetical protein